MKPCVSIVVPVYNVEDYLEKCVDSIIGQTYQNLEIILVDDGSNDSSGVICDQLKLKYNRIQVVHKVNGGLSSARNSGMEVATGEYMLFIDSDDYIKENTVERCVEAALENQADLVVFDMEYLYDDGTVTFASGGSFTKGNMRENPDLIYINNSACNKMIHRSLLKNFSFPIGMWYEDLASIPLLVSKAKCIVKVDEPFYVYYQRTNSIAHSSDPRIFDVYRAIDRVQKEIDSSIRSLYLIHGLDLTTLRIKEFSDCKMAVGYLKQNMKLLNEYYPQWRKDPLLKTYSFKKKVIFKLMDLQLMNLVLLCFRK